MTELMDFSIENRCFSAQHNPNWSKYLPTKIKKNKQKI